VLHKLYVLQRRTFAKANFYKTIYFIVPRREERHRLVLKRMDQ
jgi:hypothetical protein